ncbi:hypothetical protein M9H77_23508 [Catharanthus roseus]|uniref:Uncharacterized protein n=1 Tax=Catharanthus roseus TaxID=4058 RepID=A0ACC0AV15_CATRO|nr:hypothetical protein M9H77_23508 [Catharanthus roseus]
MELALFAKLYNEKVVKEFYANNTKDFGNSESLAYGHMYMRRHVIDFLPANIAHYLSCPYYSDIEGIGLEEEVNFDEVVKVLTGDVGAIWPKTNRLNSNLIKMPYRALFRVFCGNWLPTTNLLMWSPTPSTQGHPGPVHSTRQQSIKKKHSNTHVALPSPPPPSADSSEVSTSLDLLNQQLSDAWPCGHRLGPTALPNVVSRSGPTVAGTFVQFCRQPILLSIKWRAFSPKKYLFFKQRIVKLLPSPSPSSSEK